MPAYRFEIAKTGRAICKSTDCKTGQVKILKGELRYGSLVSGSDFDSWSWKHWGCITPAQIDNLLKSIDGFEVFEEDPDVLDGYDEVGEENQEKIRTALKEGHVPDEDWNGDLENNRLGARGMKKNRTPKRKKKGDEEEGEAETEADTSPSKAKAQRNKKAKTAGSGDEAPDASPAPKKKAPRKRKAPVEDDGSAPEKPAKKARSRKPKQKAQTEEGSEPEVMPTKKQRGKKAVPATPTDGALDDDVTAEVKPARTSRAKKIIAEEEVENHHATATTADAMEAKPIKKSRVKKAVMEEAEPALEAATEPAKTTASRGRPKKNPKATKLEESPADVDDAPAAAEKAMNGTPAVVAEAEAEAETEPDVVEPAKEKPGARRGGRKRAAKA